MPEEKQHNNQSHKKAPSELQCRAPNNRWRHFIKAGRAAASCEFYCSGRERGVIFRTNQAAFIRHDLQTRVSAPQQNNGTLLSGCEIYFIISDGKCEFRSVWIVTGEGSDTGQLIRLLYLHPAPWQPSGKSQGGGGGWGGTAAFFSFLRLHYSPLLPPLSFWPRLPRLPSLPTVCDKF